MGANGASGRNRASRKNLVTAGHCLLEDFDSLNREKTVFILPVSSLEVHGYHLPNDTDMTSAVIMAEESGRLFAGKHADWKVVLLPLLNIGTDELPLPGSIEFSRQTVYRALTEYARSLSRWGFRNLVITNGHGGPKHNLAIDDACRTCNRRYGMRVIAPGIRIFQDFIFGKRFRALEAEMSRKLTAAEKAGLTDLEHAGGWETSIILAENRALVGKNYRAYGSSRIQLGKGVIRLARREKDRKDHAGPPGADEGARPAAGGGGQVPGDRRKDVRPEEGALHLQRRPQRRQSRDREGMEGRGRKRDTSFHGKGFRERRNATFKCRIELLGHYLYAEGRAARAPVGPGGGDRVRSGYLSGKNGHPAFLRQVPDH